MAELAEKAKAEKAKGALRRGAAVLTRTTYTLIWKGPGKGGKGGKVVPERFIKYIWEPLKCRAAELRRQFVVEYDPRLISAVAQPSDSESDSPSGISHSPLEFGSPHDDTVTTIDGNTALHIQHQLALHTSRFGCAPNVIVSGASNASNTAHEFGGSGLAQPYATELGRDPGSDGRISRSSDCASNRSGIAVESSKLEPGVSQGLSDSGTGNSTGRNQPTEGLTDESDTMVSSSSAEEASGDDWPGAVKSKLKLLEDCILPLQSNKRRKLVLESLDAVTRAVQEDENKPRAGQAERSHFDVTGKLLRRAKELLEVALSDVGGATDAAGYEHVESLLRSLLKCINRQLHTTCGTAEREGAEAAEPKAKSSVEVFYVSTRTWKTPQGEIRTSCAQSDVQVASYGRGGPLTDTMVEHEQTASAQANAAGIISYPQFPQNVSRIRNTLPSSSLRMDQAIPVNVDVDVDVDVDTMMDPHFPQNDVVDGDLALRIHSIQEAVAPQALAMPTSTPALPAFTFALPAACNSAEDAAAAHAALPMPPRSAVRSSSINQTRSAKSRLQEAVAKMKRPANAVDLAIEYVTTKEEGLPHERVFEVMCSVSFGDVSICTVGTGKSKKGAEEDAATKALANLRARSIGNFH